MVGVLPAWTTRAGAAVSAPVAPTVVVAHTVVASNDLAVVAVVGLIVVIVAMNSARFGRGVVRQWVKKG